METPAQTTKSLRSSGGSRSSTSESAHSTTLNRNKAPVAAPQGPTQAVVGPSPVVKKPLKADRSDSSTRSANSLVSGDGMRLKPARSTPTLKGTVSSLHAVPSQGAQVSASRSSKPTDSRSDRSAHVVKLLDVSPSASSKSSTTRSYPQDIGTSDSESSTSLSWNHASGQASRRVPSLSKAEPRSSVCTEIQSTRFCSY